MQQTDATNTPEKTIQIIENDSGKQLDLSNDELKEEVEAIGEDILSSQTDYKTPNSKYAEVKMAYKVLNVLKLSADMVLFCPIVATVEFINYFKEILISKGDKNPILEYLGLKNALRYISHAELTKSYLMLDYLRYKFFDGIDLGELRDFYDQRLIDKKIIIENILNKSLKECLDET